MACRVENSLVLCDFFLYFNKNLNAFLNINFLYRPMPCLPFIFSTLHCLVFTDHKRQENYFFTFILLLYDLIPPRGLAGTDTIHILLLHSVKFSRSSKCQNSQKIRKTRLLKQASDMTNLSVEKKRRIKLRLI